MFCIPNNFFFSWPFLDSVGWVENPPIDVQINNFTKGNHKGLPLPANMLSVGAIPRASPVK